MIRRIYRSQKEKTQPEVWEEAKQKAENKNQHPTADEFAETILSEITAGRISVIRDYVPIEVDERRDEIYFSREKKLMMGRTKDTVWFRTEDDECIVQNELSEILDSFGVNLGIVTTQDSDDSVRYDIKIPFITESERQSNIREDTVQFAREMREYVDVDDSNIVGDCPKDDCTGKKYRSGMGSCGPKYKCTRFGCGFQFVRDVL